MENKRPELDLMYIKKMKKTLKKSKKKIKEVVKNYVEYMHEKKERNESE